MAPYTGKGSGDKSESVHHAWFKLNNNGKEEMKKSKGSFNLYKSVQTYVTKRHETEGRLIAWTDGSCEPNPDGYGGWGVVIEKEGETIAEYRGGEGETTNNRMEMLAAIMAIKNTTGPVIVRTDSQLVLLCATGRWNRKANLDLWKMLDEVSAGREVMYEWWRGHIGTEVPLHYRK